MTPHRDSDRLDSGSPHAAEVPVERRLIQLDNEQWVAFLAALAAPSEPMPRLERLLREPGVLDVP
jgi:uncharacterized protein (DUF1778 family)